LRQKSEIEARLSFDFGKIRVETVTTIRFERGKKEKKTTTTVLLAVNFQINSIEA
jgi:aminopeptidase N